MGENELVRRLVGLLHATYGERSRQAAALLDWARDWQDHYWPDAEIAWGALPALVAALPDDVPSERDALVEAIGDVLALPEFDRTVLAVGVTLQRNPRLAALRRPLEAIDVDIVALTGLIAGAASGAAVRESLPVALGLLEIELGGLGGTTLAPSWAFDKLLTRGVADRDRLADAMAGACQRASLGLDAFSGVPEVDLLVRLLKGALAGEAGINILIHGPPGTGKTELARTLAEAAGAALFAVGESDEDGDEPTRFDRLAALRRAQHVLARREGAVLLFDEMEDLVGETRQGGAGYDTARMGSKIFLNRMLEHNRVPMIWVSNAIAMIDNAHLRRMSFVLHVDHPRSGQRAATLARIAETEAMPAAAAPLAELARDEPGVAAVARGSIRAARIAGGDADDARTVAGSLLAGLSGVTLPPPATGEPLLDLDLFESDPLVASLVARLTAPDASAAFSVLLTGPPGTGKTALAGHVARGLDRPLHVRRASDLLSKWVGDTEKNIAGAFVEARRDGAVLLFDEVDSLLFDRAAATRSWEVTQVNELLTWMDGHALPFFAASNHPGRIDPAALRRFVFKLRLEPLSAERVARAFERFFDAPAPAALARVANLTPGDFAVVKRQLPFTAPADAEAIVALLEAESRAKPGASGRLGF